MKKYENNNRRCFAGALVSVLFGTVFGVVLQFIKGDVLDYAAAGDVRSTVISAALLIGFIACEVIGFHLYSLFSAAFTTRCFGELKCDIFSSILRRSYVDYREHQQGEYIAKFTGEAATIKERRFSMLPVLWEILFKLVLVSAALFALDWRIAIITIALLTTPLYVPKLIEKRLQHAQTAYIKATEACLAKMSDWLSGFEIIKNYSIERRIMERFGAANTAEMQAQLKDARLGVVSQLITTLISYISYFIVLACAAWLVLTGDFTAGDFFVAIGMIDQLSWPLISLAGIVRQLVSVKPTCVALREFIEAPGEDIGCGTTVLERDIQFGKVTFSYDGSRNVLEGFELTMQKGKRYLLKGPSGCGKTTAIDLLLKYYDVTGGSIRIDGKPISEIGSSYGMMTVVRQEATLFHDTLRNNLTMYREISDEKLIEALRSVGLERYASPTVLDGMVEEGGDNFSGGEKKRICLARALLRDTDVLILDEPLANLDPATAERIEDVLLSISGRTVLIVSHQFSKEKLEHFEKVVELKAA